MADPPLPRWREDYADTKKSQLPAAFSASSSKRWLPFGVPRRVFLVLLGCAAIVGLWAVSGGRLENNRGISELPKSAKDGVKASLGAEPNENEKKQLALPDSDNSHSQFKSTNDAEMLSKVKDNSPPTAEQRRKSNDAKRKSDVAELDRARERQRKEAKERVTNSKGDLEVSKEAEDAAVKASKPPAAPSGPPYSPSDFPELVSNVGCQTSLCDRQNLTYARTMILHAWRSYLRYAKGADDLYPVQRAPRNWYGSSLLNTPIDSLDTLWLAGLRSEYKEARKLVEDFEPSKQLTVSFFETTIRQLGGLLSAYALSGSNDTLLLSKAQQLADSLSGAFTESAAGLPMGQVNLAQRTGFAHGWMGGGLSLAEVGTFQLEFTYLAHALGKEGEGYRERVERANEVLMKLRGMVKVKGLWPLKIMPGLEGVRLEYERGLRSESFLGFKNGSDLVVLVPVFALFAFELSGSGGFAGFFLWPFQHAL